MSSQGGVGDCVRKTRWGGHRVQSVLLGRLHKWLQLLSHDICLFGSHLIVRLQSRHISNLPFGPACYYQIEFAYTVSWEIQSNSTGIINWERIPNIHLTQPCTRVTADKVHTGKSHEFSRWMQALVSGGYLENAWMSLFLVWTFRSITVDLVLIYCTSQLFTVYTVTFKFLTDKNKWWDDTNAMHFSHAGSSPSVSAVLRV